MSRQGSHGGGRAWRRLPSLLLLAIGAGLVAAPGGAAEAERPARLSADRTGGATASSASRTGAATASSAARTGAATASSAARTSKPAARGLRLLDLFTREGGPVEPGAVPRGLAGMAPADCASCHAQIAAEWQGSAHARAFTDAVFQAEYLPDAERFCQKCHAPLVTDPAAASAPALLARGVDCAVCHVRDGHVLGAGGLGAADHQARRETRLRTSAFCGSCHQFDFPEPALQRQVRYHPGRPLQNTLVEWTQSAYARVACQECHMPPVAAEQAGARPHRSHAFRTFEDPALLAGAVRVGATARWRGKTLEVAVSLAPGKIGHAFPTGDMFRQARLEVSLGATTRAVVLERIFASTITENARGHLLGQVDDTRVLPAKLGPALRHVLRFEGAADAGGAGSAGGAGDAGGAGEVVRWSLTLFRLDPAVARQRNLPSELVAIPVAKGTLEVPARTSPRRR